MAVGGIGALPCSRSAARAGARSGAGPGLACKRGKAESDALAPVALGLALQRLTLSGPRERQCATDRYRFRAGGERQPVPAGPALQRRGRSRRAGPVRKGQGHEPGPPTPQQPGSGSAGAGRLRTPYCTEVKKVSYRSAFGVTILLIADRRAA